MDDNMKELIEKAKEIGHDEVPLSKRVEAKNKILEILNSEPEKQFKTITLNIFLQDADIEISNISTILSELVQQGKCEKIQNGLYRANFRPFPKKTILEKIKLNLQKLF